MLQAKGQPGDFEAMASGEVIRFQAAYISPDEISQVVTGLASHAPRVTA